MGIGSCAGIALPERVQIVFRKRRIVVGRERHRLLALRKPHPAHRTVVSLYLPKSLLLRYRRFHNKPIMGLAVELAGDNSRGLPSIQERFSFLLSRSSGG